MVLPDPPIPADMDLSKLDGFMLDTVKLLGSELVALSTGEEFKAAVMLWCRSWKQRPACSLPNDDRVLASFAMVPPSRWKKVKPMAMRGFELCSDGRFYHKVLALDALRADKAAKQRRKAINARWGKGTDGDTEQHTEPDTKSIRPNGTRNYGTATKSIPTVARDGTGRDVRIPPSPPAKANVNSRHGPDKDVADMASAFYSIREEVFGNVGKPSDRDLSVAKAWVEDGASFELVRGHFEEQMRQMGKRGAQPPQVLSFFNDSVRRSIAPQGRRA